jgi:Ca2+-binding RTX toxin-like protein
VPFVTVASSVAPLSGSSITLFSAGDDLLEFGSNGGTRLRVLDEDGNIVVPEFAPGIFLTSPTLLANGDILGIDNNAVLRFDQTGALVDQTVGFTPGPGRTTELANGNILVTYEDAGGDLRGQLLTPALDLIGTNFAITSNASYASEVTALAGGGFAVFADKNGSTMDVLLTFDANGVAAGSPVNASDYSFVEIEALSDGGYVFSGTQYFFRAGFGFQESYVRFFNADGTARSNAFHVSRVADSVSTAALDGDLVVVNIKGSYSQLYHSSGRILVDRIDTPYFSMEGGAEGIDADTFVSRGRQTTGGPTELIYWSVDRPNILLGDSTGETFFGAAATDRVMAGFGGDDIFNVDSAGDIVREWAGEGNDTVFSSVSYQLTAGAVVELLRTVDEVATTALDLTGNELAQTIRGNAGANQLAGGGGGDTLIGLGGNDVYVVSHAGDVVEEAAGGGTDRIYARVDHVLAAGSAVETLTTDLHSATVAINLTGNALVQGLYGNAGVNQLNGGGGADSLVGFAGDDSYVIVDGDESVFEAVGGGNDRVFAAVDYRLRAGAEVETISTDFDDGTAAIDLVGNEFGQTLRGNAGANRLTGGGGGDLMIGLGGNDWYFVNHSGDVVNEAVGGGTDRIFASVSYTLAADAEVENLSTSLHSSTVALNLTGNALVQGIYGNEGANQLNGGGGADSLVGFGGNDWYFIVAGSEYVFEGADAGADRVFAAVDYRLNAGAQVESLTTDASFGTAAIDLTGNEFAQAVYGNAGANILDGGLGRDALIGNGGADIFLFSTALDVAGAGVRPWNAYGPTANVDRIDGFGSDDRIGLDAALFGLTPGALAPGAFALGTTATEADDRILYDQATGTLRFDSDGAGHGISVRFAYIDNLFSLDASYFVVI